MCSNGCFGYPSPGLASGHGGYSFKVTVFVSPSFAAFFFFFNVCAESSLLLGLSLVVVSEGCSLVAAYRLPIALASLAAEHRF